MSESETPKFGLEGAAANPALRINWFKYAAPQAFFPVAGKLAPWFAVLAAVSCVIGLYVSFFVAPTDAQQGDAFRILYIHEPVAWMALFIYAVMAFWGAVVLVFDTRLSGMMANALAPTGALFAFLALWTGSLWGKPIWDTWWAWEARLTAEMILLLLYFAFAALHVAIDRPRVADRAAAVLALLGVLSVPMAYYAMQWWSNLPHAAPVSLKRMPSLPAATLVSTALMLFACWMYSIAASFWRVRSLILERERDSEWVAHYVRTLR